MKRGPPPPMSVFKTVLQSARSIVNPMESNSLSTRETMSTKHFQLSSSLKSVNSERTRVCDPRTHHPPQPSSAPCSLNHAVRSRSSTRAPVIQ
jgi:hypothetical protein